MLTVTSDYKRTEQNREPHSNLDLVLVSCSLQTNRSWLLRWPWETLFKAEVPTAQLQHVLRVPGLIFSSSTAATHMLLQMLY